MRLERWERHAAVSDAGTLEQWRKVIKVRNPMSISSFTSVVRETAEFRSQEAMGVHGFLASELDWAGLLVSVNKFWSF